MLSLSVQQHSLEDIARHFIKESSDLAPEIKMIPDGSDKKNSLRFFFSFENTKICDGQLIVHQFKDASVYINSLLPEVNYIDRTQRLFTWPQLDSSLEKINSFFPLEKKASKQDIIAINNCYFTYNNELYPTVELNINLDDLPYKIRMSNL